jgi:predicted patatin/cPLA2 family phospholipase
MRGVVSTAMLTALEQMGMRDVFDDVYGSSAGAVNGAYFIAGQSAYGTTVYYDELLTRRFIDFRRIYGKKPVMSLEFLFDEIVEDIKPLKWDRVFSSRIKLHIIAASLEDLKSVDLGHLDEKETLREALRASARVPLFAGVPVQVEGKTYLDASLFESIPYTTAIRDGSTHVLVLKTRPREVLRGKPSLLERTLIRRRLAKISSGLADAYMRRAEEYAKAVTGLRRYQDEPTEGPPYVFTIEPMGDTPVVRQFERSRERVVAGAKSGVRAVYSALEGHDPLVLEILHAF